MRGDWKGRGARSDRHSWTRWFAAGVGAVSYDGGRNRRMRAESSSRIIEARFSGSGCFARGRTARPLLRIERAKACRFLTELSSGCPCESASTDLMLHCGFSAQIADCGAPSPIHEQSSGLARDERYHKENDMPIFPASATLAWKAGALLSTFTSSFRSASSSRRREQARPGLPDLRPDR